MVRSCDVSGDGGAVDVNRDLDSVAVVLLVGFSSGVQHSSVQFDTHTRAHWFCGLALGVDKKHPDVDVTHSWSMRNEVLTSNMTL